MIHIFNGFVPVVAVWLAITGDDVLSTGQKIGTSSNQVLLGCLVVVLIVVVIYLGRKQDKANAVLADKQEAMINQMDAERKAFGDERKARIEGLMKMMTENSIALNRTATAELAMATAVDAMKLCIHTNTEMTKQLLEHLKMTAVRAP